MGDDTTRYLNRRAILQYTGTAMAAAGLTSVTAAGARAQGLDDVTFTLTEFPDTIDPLGHITGDYFDVYDHIYEPVFDFVPDEGVSSRIAEDWEVTDDGTTTVELRDDVVFHDGSELTAADVAWTIDRTVDPDLGIASEIGSFGMGSIEGAEAVNDHTLEINYGAAPGLAEFEFGNYTRAINEEWAIETHGADEGEITGADPEDFNGTGPYEVVDFTSGEEIVLSRFEDYWGEEPPFEQLTFNATGEAASRVAAVETGESELAINILPEDVPTVQEATGVEIRNVTSFRTVFLPMKNTVEPFDSQEFRQAMNYAVDNEEIVSTILGGFGEPRGQPVSPGVFGYNPDIEPYEQDVERAEELVEESGYAGAEIELYAPSGRYVQDAATAERAADMIDDLDNVSCDLNIVDFGVVSDANSAGVDPDEIDIVFYMIGWGVITGDTDYGVQGFFTIPDNPARTFDDEELSDAILESQQIEDPDDREEALMAVNALAHEKAPFVFLHTQESIYGVDEEIQWEPREDENIHAWEMDV